MQCSVARDELQPDRPMDGKFVSWAFFNGCGRRDSPRLAYEWES